MNHSVMTMLFYDHVLNTYTMKAERRYIHNAYNDAFMQLCLYIQPDISLEIGAHEATYSKYIRKNIPQCKVFAFEANPHVYNRFVAEGNHFEGITYINKVVSDHEGAALFIAPVDPRSGIGSILLGNVNNKINFDKEKIQIESVTVDSFLNNYPETENICMWIDVEGASREVLLGATQSFANKKITLVNIEVESTQMWKNQWIDIDVISFFCELGFTPLIVDNEYGKQQYNITFLKNSCLNFEIYRVASEYLAQISNVNSCISIKLYDDFLFLLGQQWIVAGKSILPYPSPNKKNFMMKFFIQGLPREIHYEIYTENAKLNICAHFELSDKDKKKYFLDVFESNTSMLKGKFTEFFRGTTYHMHQDRHGISVTVPLNINFLLIYRDMLHWLINETIQLIDETYEAIK